MTTISIAISNSNESSIYLQVDPWAGVYVLKKGDSIEILAESETDSPSFSIEEYQDTRILTIENSTDYFVMRDGGPVIWRDFPTNM